MAHLASVRPHLYVQPNPLAQETRGPQTPDDAAPWATVWSASDLVAVTEELVVLLVAALAGEAF